MNQTVILLIVFAVGCAASQKKVEKPEPVTTPKKDVVKSCAQAIQQFQNRTQGKRTAVKTCASMWKKPKCREAWTSKNDNLTNHIMRSCAEAYCGDGLESALCEVPPQEIDILSDTHAWFSLWRSFNHEVLRADLQMTETGAVGDVAVALLLAVSQRGLNEPLEDRLQIGAIWQNNRWFLDVMPRGSEPSKPTRFEIPVPNQLSDFSALMEYLQVHDVAGDVLVKSSKPLDAETKTHLLLSLRSAGFSVIQFSSITRRRRNGGYSGIVISTGIPLLSTDKI